VGFRQLVAHASRLANIQENPPWPAYHINDNTLKTHDNTLKRAMEEQDSTQSAHRTTTPSRPTKAQHQELFLHSKSPSSITLQNHQLPKTQQTLITLNIEFPHQHQQPKLVTYL